ncbi:Proton-coupled folate transporter [Halotydeus destructor]|nr:Proton-coupled folate transporter [Halotydeus destructor]
MFKWSSWFKFLKLLTVEPYLFLITFSFLIKHATLQQFVQDKICLIDLGKNDDLCYHVTSSEAASHRRVANTILKKTAEYEMVLAILRTLPGIALNILAGPWTDRVKGARKTLMMVAATGQALDAIMGLLNVYHERTWGTPLLLLTILPSSLLGGMTTVQTAVMGYASLTTPKKYLSLRFVILEIILNAATPLTSFIGGQVLASESLIPDEIRNFATIYLLCLLTSLSALLWVVFFIDDSDQAHVKEVTNGTAFQSSNRDTATRMLDMNNIKDMFRVCTKRREHLEHIQLWLLLLSNGICMLSVVGTASVMFLFSQRMGIGIPVMVKIFKFSDSALSVVGVSSIGLCFVTLGTFLKPAMFFVSFALGSLGGGCLVGIKALISKLIDETETGSVFAILAIFQSILNMVATSLYTFIYIKTIDNYPGSVIQFAGAINLIPLISIIWIDLYRMNNGLNTRDQVTKL